VLLDALLWAALSLPVALALISPSQGGPLRWRPVLSLLLMAVAVAVSRRYPLASLVIVVGWTLQDGNVSFAIPVMSYLVGVRMRAARPAALAFAAIVAAGTVLNVVVLDTGAATWFFLTATLLFAGVLPWLVGRYRRQHQELLRAGWERADRLERERQFIAEQSRLRERSRIARDMHDSLGHELSLIALRAGALEVCSDPNEQRQAASELRMSAAGAIERLRDIIGVLSDRTDPAPLEPVHESVAGLVERARRSGLAARLRLDGDPVERSPMLERAVYRVVQESLTNAARHAPGAEVVVLLNHSAEETTVSVTNGRPPAGPLPGSGAPGGSGNRGHRAGRAHRAGPARGRDPARRPVRRGFPAARPAAGTAAGGRRGRPTRRRGRGGSGPRRGHLGFDEAVARGPAAGTPQPRRGAHRAGVDRGGARPDLLLVRHLQLGTGGRRLRAAAPRPGAGGPGAGTPCAAGGAAAQVPGASRPARDGLRVLHRRQLPVRAADLPAVLRRRPVGGEG
jgi:signal transduction histidine kinase